MSLKINKFLNDFPQFMVHPNWADHKPVTAWQLFESGNEHIPFAEQVDPFISEMSQEEAEEEETPLLGCPQVHRILAAAKKWNWENLPFKFQF